jgi:small conductance mechanosensitive channel
MTFKTFPRSLLLALAIGMPAAAPAQTVAVHQAAPAAATTPTPAKATASAIIPGSPLAALTGASPTATPDDAPDLFSTDNVGLSVMTRIADEASVTISEFGRAIKHSTELTPVWQWLRDVLRDPAHRLEVMQAFGALALTILPGLGAEAILLFLLTRPRAALVRYAIHWRERDLARRPDPIEAAESGETEKRPGPKLSFLGWLRRFGLASVYILLALLPLFGFALTVGILIGAGLVGVVTARLIVIGVANAYLVCRLIAEILRFLYAPKAPDLRLIHTTDRRAIWMVRSISTLVITTAAGYIFISACEILGLPKDGARVLVLLVALAVHIELAVLIWQSRRIVAGWIRGKPDEARMVFGIRERLAGFWHYLALFYVLALWVAYAGGIHNAFSVLLRVIVVFVAAVVIARLVWFGIAHGLDRFFDVSETDTERHPTLRARARAYNPLVRLVLRVIIGLVMVVLMIQGWGINILPWLAKDPLSRSLISAFIAILITVAIALILWEMSNALMNGRIDRLAATGRSRQASRLRTLLPMLKATIGVVIFLGAGLICLGKIGVNLVPLLAVSGVAGIAIGFGSQKLVQDIITGLFLLLEDAMQVGDVITLAGMSGTVERLSIRTIRLRGGDGSINIIPFSAVTTVTNQTRDFGYAQISIEVSYEEDLARVYAVLQDIAKTMRAEPAWGAMMRDDLQIFGLDQFGPSALVITGQIRTGPGQHWAVRRQFYARVKKRFDEEGIEIPYTYLPPAPPKPADPPPPPPPDSEKV